MDKISFSPAALRRFDTGTVSRTAEAATKSEKTVSFGEWLEKSVAEVNESQVKSDNSIADFLTGKGSGLHETMMAVEKADISMRLLVQVRNKAVEAYKEIMRMQV